ncbi:MAG: bifunctional phosphoribosylaminoimidazolecarboxamide formyltransferase/IMP cyclohydrolase [Granulosicoccus sp.]|nr:bifunctional phosphoribosylaminoimidazolecarboxamide formyltransferase/IMP cyclohydrolase [Granulosicoccus sp.]
MPDQGKAYALLSVSDKRGIEVLAKAFVDAGILLLSTGGTAKVLRDAGIHVKEVSEHTGAAEMMQGRVKTLHPLIHGGILARRGIDDQVLCERGIDRIDFVVVNLYPFAATVARKGITFDEAIENIDIGGPAMLRSAAKNHESVTVVTDPDDYRLIIDNLALEGERGKQLRLDLACKAFDHTARYDRMISNYLARSCTADTADSSQPASEFPESLDSRYEKIRDLRYGENPHQKAAFYRTSLAGAGTLAGSTLVQGKAMSYNNVMDADAALGCVQQFVDDDACVIVKHANPCGVALADCQIVAYEQAFRTDPTSAFGGIIAFNRQLQADTATVIIEKQFVELIVAPGISPAAADILGSRPNVRVLDCIALSSGECNQDNWLLRPVSGGVLVQSSDALSVSKQDLKIVSQRKPSTAELEDLLFTWRVAKYVKSNAIVYGRDRATLGIGAGQMSRVYSARIAGIKAMDEGLDVRNAVMASDAFFPFRDGIDHAAEAGIAAVIQPGGSRNDDEVIAAADEHAMAMIFTGIRHFRH